MVEPFWKLKRQKRLLIFSRRGSFSHTAISEVDGMICAQQSAASNMDRLSEVDEVDYAVHIWQRGIASFLCEKG